MTGLRNPSAFVAGTANVQLNKKIKYILAGRTDDVFDAKTSQGPYKLTRNTTVERL
jgi:hypothetical protein